MFSATHYSHKHLPTCQCHTSTPNVVSAQMHVCMEMANIFEAQGKIDDAYMHRGSAIRHLQTSVLGADCMFVANMHAKNGHMLHKVCMSRSALFHDTESRHRRLAG
jgi:hypothetical protein